MHVWHADLCVLVFGYVWTSVDAHGFTADLKPENVLLDADNVVYVLVSFGHTNGWE